jgi:hypothetical protein
MISLPNILDCALCAIEKDYRDRRAVNPHLSNKCRRISSSLDAYPRSADALRASAQIYASLRLRGSKVLFASHDDTNLFVDSYHGFETYDQPYFKGPKMGPLMVQLLAERSSLLIGSFDTSKNHNHIPVFLFDETGGMTEEVINDWSLAHHSPVTLEGVGIGQALVTPLGFDHMTSLAYGLIYEYRPTSFLLKEIPEARVYSSAFMVEIARRIAANY